jgi:cytochrome oxidase Cu insertion factor (SCO1/SenC/PrrC family)
VADSLAAPEEPEKATFTLVAFGLIVLITGAWWILALWPVASEAPGWLIRTRAFCFGVERNSLPSTSGWVSLVGEPIALTLALFAIQGRGLADSVRAVNRRPAGRFVLLLASLVLVAGVSAAGVRVAGGGALAGDLPPELDAGVERLGAPAPPIRLQDQSGSMVSLAEFHGRVALVAFAYGHCETVCPLIVEEVLRARRSAGEPPPVVLIVTLDPWRDRPSRLPSIAARWKMPTGTFVLSGTIDQVERVLDDWRVVRQRDPLTGEITHATPVFVVDAAGRLVARAEPFTASIGSALRASSATRTGS